MSLSHGKSIALCKNHRYIHGFYLAIGFEKKLSFLQKAKLFLHFVQNLTQLPNLQKSSAFSEKGKLFHRLNVQNLGHWEGKRERGRERNGGRRKKREHEEEESKLKGGRQRGGRRKEEERQREVRGKMVDGTF